MGAQAVSLLQELGYTNVAHFVGGLHDWQEAGLPLEAAAGPESVAPRVDAPVGMRTVRRSPSSEHGRWLIELFERRSTADLVALWFGTIVICAVLYWIFSLTAMGGLREGARNVDAGASGFLTALYFSFVTATSVGFGDVVPLGPLRAVAIGEAVTGLLIFGAVVSKLVSRRQEQVVSEIHRIAFEDRLERVQTDLHLVLSELQTIAQLCKATDTDANQVRARLDSASGMCLAELRTIHDLLYRPQSLPEETILEGIIASLAIVVGELRDLLRCVPSRSTYLSRNLAGLSKLADEICADCVPRRYAQNLREWMDTIQQAARDLV
jgi:hypothetical protein